MATSWDPLVGSVRTQGGLMWALMYFASSFFLINSRPAAAESQPGGKWEILVANSGVSAMHMALLPNNKIIIFDRSDYGPSNMSLPQGKCRIDPNDLALPVDCWAHSIEYDIDKNRVRPLTIQTDTWCSSGALAPDGRLVQTGGYNDGDRVVRIFNPCEGCDWIETPGGLARRRWYATDQILPDGRIIVVGGRRQFSYEFVPKAPGQSGSVIFTFPFLQETRDGAENNLYPFVHLAPDGNLFIFANTRSILFDYLNDRIVRSYPDMPGGPRNYPSSGSSVLLPLDALAGDAEVMICGGAGNDSAFSEANRGLFLPASETCGRLRITDREPRWAMENMPMRRVMGDMLLLPTGDVLIINGASNGTAGWFLARDPILNPLLYDPDSHSLQILRPSGIPRMYHSACHVMPDGRVLVGGSNPNIFYNFTGVLYPTNLTLEAFSPPYLNSQMNRPFISSHGFGNLTGYGTNFTFRFFLKSSLDRVSVTILAPSFTTHSYSMNQRLLKLGIIDLVYLPKSSAGALWSASCYQISVAAPLSKALAPPGYYLLFVVNAGIPSPGKWVRLQSSSRDY